MQHFSLKQIALAVVGGKVMQMWYSNGHCSTEKCLCSQENYILPKKLVSVNDHRMTEKMQPILKERDLVRLVRHSPSWGKAAVSTSDRRFSNLF